MHPPREPIGPGQESVWDYPRPPRIEAITTHLRIEVGGRVLAETRAGQRVLETSHPPTYYFPPDAIERTLLIANPRRSFCEWKGQAHYWDVRIGDRVLEAVGWSYPNPTPGCGLAPGAFAFYAAPMERCLVDGEVATPQPGGFYGGWVTWRVVGPFKGGPGSWGW